MRILWWRREEEKDVDRERKAEEARRALLDSEIELLSAKRQAQEASGLATELRRLRGQNHFGQRMRIGIQEGLRHE